MLTLLIISIIGIIFANYMMNKYHLIAGIYTFLISLLFGLMIAIAIPSKTEIIIKDCHYLESNNGQLFLKYKDGYVFYYKTGEDLKMKCISYDKTIITQTNNKPKIVKITKTETNEFINHFSINLPELYNYIHFYVIYLPNNQK